MLGNTDDAADAVHDVFVKALKKPEAYDSNTGPLAPWFLRVLRNHCIDLLRRRRPGGVDVESLIAPDPGPQDCMETTQRDRALQRALQTLSVEQRQIIVLRDYMDLSYAGIANALEIAPGTVMSRLHRARMALKKELTRHD